MMQISIGGAVRPFKFGFNAIDIFCRERSITLAQFTGRLDEFGKGAATPGELRDIIYAGLAGGALACGLPVTFTAIAVGDWMDELQAEELTKLVNAFTESITTPVKKKEKAIGAKP